MIAEIISIGSELMFGSTLNTNSKYLSEKLIDLGIETRYHTSVDDNSDRIKEVLSISLNRSDLIIFTGGLGPTKDDLTKETICEYLKLDLVLDYKALEDIEKFFKDINRPMTKNNIKQAYRPNDGIFLKNKVGTAPGLFIKYKDKKIILLPGPPNEINPMFTECTMKYLKNTGRIIIKNINTVGIGESFLETEIRKLNICKKKLEIATFAKDGYVQIKLISKEKDINLAEKNLNNAISLIEKKFEKYIYTQENIGLEEYIVKKLIEKNLKIGFCESCTGGLLTSKITKISNASKILDRSLIVYSNESKIETLNVDIDIINKYGAVNSKVAYQMAKGLFDMHKMDIVVSTTGIAGPSSDDFNNPIGLVYICLISKYGHKISKKIYKGDRYLIQNKVSIEALDMIRKELNKNH